MDNSFYTYAYLRENGTPYYIGKGKGNRAFEKAGRKRNPPPRGRILFLKRNITEEEAIKHEVYMIAVLGRKDEGEGILWNLTDGGDGISGYRHSEETRSRMSKAMRGNTNPKGHKRSEETRRKISEAQTGKKLSEETRRKISEVQKGKKLPEETRKKISKALQGIKRSDETRKKVSEARKGIKLSAESIRKRTETRRRNLEAKKARGSQ